MQHCTRTYYHAHTHTRTLSRTYYHAHTHTRTHTITHTPSHTRKINVLLDGTHHLLKEPCHGLDDEQKYKTAQRRVRLARSGRHTTPKCILIASLFPPPSSTTTRSHADLVPGRGIHLAFLGDVDLYPGPNKCHVGGDEAQVSLALVHEHSSQVCRPYRVHSVLCIQEQRPREQRQKGRNKGESKRNKRERTCVCVCVCVWAHSLTTFS